MDRGEIMFETRNERLERDYHEMMKLQDRPYMSWTAIKGEPPYTEEYLLDVRLRTYALSTEAGAYTVGAIRRCLIKITLWGSYPQVAPNITMLNIPPVFHPDWFSKGTYSPFEPWKPEDSLKDYIKRMLAALQYAPDMIDTETPANYKAMSWFKRNRDNTSLFPSDTVELTENTPEETAAAERAANTFDEIIDSRI